MFTSALPEIQSKTSHSIRINTDSAGPRPSRCIRIVDSLRGRAVIGRKVDKRLELRPPSHPRSVLVVERALHSDSRRQCLVLTEGKTADQGRPNSQEASHDVDGLPQARLTAIYDGPKRAVERSAARCIWFIEESVSDASQNVVDFQAAHTVDVGKVLVAQERFARRALYPPAGSLHSFRPSGPSRFRRSPK